MNKKINAICFIFILVFLVSAVSAADNENQTLQQIQPDPCEDLSTVSIDNLDELKATNTVKQQTDSAPKVTKENVTLKVPDVKMYYKDGSKIKATLKDSKKKPIANAKIKISINGTVYNKKTDAKGTTSLDINLKSGNYIVLTTFAGTSKYQKQSTKSTLTVKSTIKGSDFAKYYTNKASYSATFYTEKGKLLKNTAVKIKLNGKTYSVKTNSKGIGKLAIDLKPGKYTISLINSKTTETISKTVTIKSLIETKDLKFNQTDTGKFKVKILNSYGKASPNKKVTLKIDGKTYSKTTDKNGIASLNLNLNSGKYTLTTEYLDITAKNKITVNKVVKISSFVHTTLIPSYVNVTLPYVFQDSAYSIKTGANGIVKMPKIELFTVQIGDKSYQFSTGPISATNAIELGYQNYLIPFDGNEIKNNINKTKLNGDGIIISRMKDYTQIDYRSSTSDNVELFGFYADKGLENSETLTYMQNDKITAKINFITQSFDENGLKFSLSKYYQKSIYDFNSKSYDEITNHNTESIRFTNTNIPVEFNIYGKKIVGYISKEDITTKFSINGNEELEKHETISYGLAEKYRKTLGFEALQSYSIISEKITQKTLEKWVNNNKLYLDRFGVMNVYGMHLASLETSWLADELADEYAGKFDVSWKRGNTATILGGINLEDTYLNILNADMGMEVKGNENNVALFRLMNSLQLPNLEEYSLEEVSTRFWNFTLNSQDNIFIAINNNNFSITQLGEMIYLFAEDGSNSAIVLNSTSGVANVILSHDNTTYKGASISTSRDCCSVGIMPKDIIAGIKNAINLFSPVTTQISDFLNQIHPISVIAYAGIKFILKRALTGVSAISYGLFSTMAIIQSVGTSYADKMVSEKELYNVLDSVTFTRPGYLQSKKVYNIPNKNGGYDYIEVKIKDDLTLDRDNAIYISDGKTKNLTKQETYQYFTNDYWSPFSVPTKYWDSSWNGIVT